MLIGTNRWGTVPWNDHIASLCVRGPKIKWTWWFGIVLHSWGVRLGFGGREVVIFWK